MADRGRPPSQAGQTEVPWEHGTRESIAHQRRFFRRAKAVAAIGLALAAGAFLACARRLPGVGDEASGDGSGSAAGESPTASAPGQPSASAAPSGDATSPAESAAAPAASATPSASASASAIVPVPSASLTRPAPRPPRPAVDPTEHRKGMPVPDNLLE